MSKKNRDSFGQALRNPEHKKEENQLSFSTVEGDTFRTKSQQGPEKARRSINISLTDYQKKS